MDEPVLITVGSRLDQLARDIAVMTPNSLYTPQEIYPAYGLSDDEYAALLTSDEFKARLDYHTNEIGTDRNALLRAQAKLMADSSVRTLHTMVHNEKLKPSDRLKAMSLLIELADAKPKAEQQFTGMVLNVSFGSGSSPAPTLEVIDHE